MSRQDPIIQAACLIAERLHSPNVVDANLEPANLVDVLHRQTQAQHRIAEAIDRLAVAVENLHERKNHG